MQTMVGRPPSENPRTDQLNIRLTEEEGEALRAIAFLETNDGSRVTWARGVLLGAVEVARATDPRIDELMERRATARVIEESIEESIAEGSQAQDPPEGRTRLIEYMKDKYDAASVVDAVLMEIFDSPSLLSFKELTEKVVETTDWASRDVKFTIRHMLDYKTPLLAEQEDSSGIVFQTAGLWTLENARIYNEGLDPLDCTVASIDVLARGFFDELVDEVAS